MVATVAHDLFLANYGVGFATSYDDDVPYTPAWQEKNHRRAARGRHHGGAAVRRQRRQDARQIHVIIGAAMNHWYHGHELPPDHQPPGDARLRRQSGGGWAHYVGQEAAAADGLIALAFALDWARPPRQMNSTSFFYAHTDQWRYEKLSLAEILSPLADKASIRAA